MHRPLTRLASTLVLVSALGSAAWSDTPLSYASQKALQPVRTAQALQHMSSLKHTFGLGDQGAFKVRTAFTNSQGEAVVRMTQTHQGYRVWRGEAIAHVSSDQQVAVSTQGVKSQVSLSGEPTLSADQAKAIALHNLALKGSMPFTPTVERVVFPTQYTGGLVSRYDTTKKRDVLDRELSIWARKPSSDYVWAYEVKTHVSNNLDGLKEYSYIIDGNTGAILRKWNDLKADAATTGTGTSFYNGTVSVPTTQSTADGTYALRSTTRGTTVNPFLNSYFGMTETGLDIMYDSYVIDPVYGSYEWFTPYAGKATDAWGDGKNFDGWDLAYNDAQTLAYFQYAPDANGETAAVDAMFGLSTTWDFYKNVFNRDGIDGQGTSTYGVVHYLTSDWYGNVNRYDNAFWSNQLFGMIFGDGTYPKTSYGFLSLTEMDITGHELTHGVSANSSGDTSESEESGGLNEGTSDIFGKMVHAYSLRPAGQDTVVPDFPAGDLTYWQMARKCGHGTPLRYLYKPSLDGISPDQWYEGIGMMDAHFSMGPLTRAFYFLSQGSSATSTDETYSPYLPVGMTGIGNDHAARIMYKALTEYLTADSDYAAARTALLQAAQDLYGSASTEVAAVQNAFAAINVGAAVGQPEPVRVTFPVVHPAGSLLYDSTSPLGILAKVQIFPVRTAVVVKADVKNTTNTAVTWSLGDPTDGTSAGVINADGTWTTPEWNYPEEFLAMKAASQADPLQYAKGRVLVASLDMDEDTETDAMDLGYTAMMWGLPAPPQLPAGPTYSFQVDDWDLVFFDEAMSNAWPVQ